MKYLKISLIYTFILFNIQNTFSQNIHNAKKSDSLNAVILQGYSLKRDSIEKLRIEDSIRKYQLEIKVNSLKSRDSIKKRRLLNEVSQLSDNNEKQIQEKKLLTNSLLTAAKGSPVIGFFEDTLFLIYGRLGSFSAKDRAEAVGNRIKKLADNFKFKADSLKIVYSETTTDIVFGENIITSISENDGLWNNSTKEDLAINYKAIISNAIIKYRSETSFITLAREGGLAALVLIGSGLIVFFISKLFKWIAGKVQQKEGHLFKGIQIKNYLLFNSGQQIKALLVISAFLKWVLILIIFYLSLLIVFGIFPWTKSYAEILLGYIVNPFRNIFNSVLNYIPNLITILVIIFFFRYILKGIHFLKTEIEKGYLKVPGFYPDWATPTFQIIRVLLFAFMIIVIFPYLPGSNSPVFQGVSVFLGFLFTFGSSGSLSNVIAGLVLTYMRPFKIGDRVKIGDVVGDVVEKSSLVTRIRTIKNEIISIPNATVMSSHTVNYSIAGEDKGLIIHTTVTIGYDVPWKEMHVALTDAALRTDLILQDPVPFVLQTSLDDFYVSYQINAYIKEVNKQAAIYSNLHQNIQDVCNEKGIEILSPHYRAARDGNMTTIPSNYLPKDYKAPGFNVNVQKGE